MKVNFKDLVTLVSSDSGVTKQQTEAVLTSLRTTVLQETQRGNSVSIPKLGIFKPKHLKERLAHIPSTGEKKLVPARSTFKFTTA